MHLDGTAHHVDDILGDRHTEASTLDLADSGSALTLKGFKDALGKLLAHADTGVLHPNLIQSASLGRIRQLGHTDRHRPASGSEFDGVGEEVQQDLVQPGLVAVNVFIRHIHDIHVQLQLLGVDLSGDDRLDIVKDIRQIGLLLLQVDLSAFNAAHIQHIVDEREQMVTGGEDLGQVVLHFLLIVNVGCGQSRETDNGVHGSTDIMGHVGKEGALCFVRLLRHEE